MRFAIVGDPVDHSLSPAIHNAGFAERGIEARFDFLRTPAARFGDVEAQLRAGSLDGVSVTMPHKGNAFAAVDALDPPASRAKSVNTIVARNGRLTGYNTDIEGVRFSMEILDLPIETPILILGYGGAAAAGVVSLATTGYMQITVSGRERAGAMELAESTGVDAGFVAWGEPIRGAIVVNATPLGMHGEGLPSPVMDHAVGLLDMTYGDAVTPAINRAKQLGIPHTDGLDMLVGQAVSAFELFTGEPAPVDALREASR